MAYQTSKTTEDILLPLLQAARQGDMSALAKAVELYYPIVRHVLERDLRHVMDGRRLGMGDSDLFQEIYARAHCDFAYFQGQSVGEFYKWLASIVAHCWTDWERATYCAAKRAALRAKSLEGETDSGEVAPSPARDGPVAEAERREQQAAVEAALANLDRRDRELIQLRYKEGHSYVEIASRLRRTTDSVRMACCRAVDELRRRVKPR